MFERDYSWLLDPHFDVSNRVFEKVSRLERREIGHLVLTSGRIVANDPLAFFQTEPFTVAVPAGTYPVSVFIAHRTDSGGQADQRIAFALVRFRDEQPARWEMALCANQDIATLKKEQFFGYGVDAGTGAFMDADAAAIVTTLRQDSVLYDEPLGDALGANYAHTREWAVFVVDKATGLNLVAFSSGWGDGTYPSFWGRSANGDPLCLLTDFLVLP
jgi:hypothetical protein